MIVWLGIGITLALTGVYAGKKSWQVLHRMAGITPGKVTYIEAPHPVSLPQGMLTLSRLVIDPQYLQYLPAEHLLQLQQIDNKAQAYFAWQQEAVAKNLDFATGLLPHIETNMVTE